MFSAYCMAFEVRPIFQPRMVPPRCQLAPRIPPERHRRHPCPCRHARQKSALSRTRSRSVVKRPSPAASTSAPVITAMTTPLVADAVAKGAEPVSSNLDHIAGRSHFGGSKRAPAPVGVPHQNIPGRKSRECRHVIDDLREAEDHPACPVSLPQLAIHPCRQLDVASISGPVKRKKRRPHGRRAVPVLPW